MRDDFVIYSNRMNRRAVGGQNAQIEIRFLVVNEHSGAANTAASSSSVYPSAAAASSNSNTAAAASSSSHPSAAASSSSHPIAADTSSSSSGLQYAASNPRTLMSSKSVRGVEKSSPKPEITTAAGVVIQKMEQPSLNLTSVMWRLSAEINRAHSERMLIAEVKSQMLHEPRIKDHKLKVISVQVISRFNPCQDCAPALSAFKQYLQARILHDPSATYRIAYRSLWIPDENNSKRSKQVSLNEANSLCAKSQATLVSDGWIWEDMLNGKSEYARFAKILIDQLNKCGKKTVTNDWFESQSTILSWLYGKMSQANISNEDKKRLEKLYGAYCGN